MFEVCVSRVFCCLWKVFGVWMSIEVLKYLRRVYLAGHHEIWEVIPVFGRRNMADTNLPQRLVIDYMNNLVSSTQRHPLQLYKRDPRLIPPRRADRRCISMLNDNRSSLHGAWKISCKLWPLSVTSALIRGHSGARINKLKKHDEQAFMRKESGYYRNAEQKVRNPNLGLTTQSWNLKSLFNQRLKWNISRHIGLGVSAQK